MAATLIRGVQEGAQECRARPPRRSGGRRGRRRWRRYGRGSGGRRSYRAAARSGSRGWRLAAIDMPMPVPQTSTPNRARPSLTALQTVVREIRIIDARRPIGAAIDQRMAGSRERLGEPRLEWVAGMVGADRYCQGQWRVHGDWPLSRTASDGEAEPARRRCGAAGGHDRAIASPGACSRWHAEKCPSATSRSMRLLDPAAVEDERAARMETAAGGRIDRARHVADAAHDASPLRRRVRHRNGGEQRARIGMVRARRTGRARGRRVRRSCRDT